MKFQFILIIALVLGLSACSGEFMELKKSPCACNELYQNIG